MNPLITEALNELNTLATALNLYNRVIFSGKYLPSDSPFKAEQNSNITSDYIQIFKVKNQKKNNKSGSFSFAFNNIDSDNIGVIVSFVPTTLESGQRHFFNLAAFVSHIKELNLALVPFTSKERKDLILRLIPAKLKTKVNNEIQLNKFYQDLKPSISNFAFQYENSDPAVRAIIKQEFSETLKLAKNTQISQTPALNSRLMGQILEPLVEGLSLPLALRHEMEREFCVAIR